MKTAEYYTLLNSCKQAKILRPPWFAAEALVGPAREQRAQTFWMRLRCLVGQALGLRRPRRPPWAAENNMGSWHNGVAGGSQPANFTKRSAMARDKGLEELLNESLADVGGITQKAMFGGLAWLMNGNLLCGAREDGMLVRLGKDRDAWALKIPGISPMIMQGRPMSGWVRAAAQVYSDDALRRKLINAAIDFNRTLPKK